MLLFFLAIASAIEPAVPLSVMADHAERVVVAEVTSTECRWEAGERGDLETVVWLATEQVVEGEAPDTLEVLVEGGQLGEHRTGVSGQPVLVEDHRYLLLLVRDFEGRPRVIGQRGAIELRSALAPEAPTLDQLRPLLVEARDASR